MEDFILHRSPINEFYANCENKEPFERKTCDVLLAIVNLFDKIKIHVHNCMRHASNLIDTEVSYRKNGLTNTNLESILTYPHLVGFIFSLRCPIQILVNLI